MPFKFLEKVSLADVAFQVSGKTLEELFSAAGLAVAATQIKNYKSIKPKTKKIFRLKGESIEQLLFKFLDELVFLKDKDLLLFNKFSGMKIKQEKSGGRGAGGRARGAESTFSLKCTAIGEKLDTKRHISLVDVKAVTMHLFEVRKSGKGWKAKVVLDV
ncbi:MAG TPA: archease [Nanoarchaeota archaeon]|nr:archease [Nanoarchaeota archaeon]HIH34648.1 archease [Nanoarchaeota archaeon]HIH51295.1 archease [Nanoarchaeota archaeon]HIH65634.1 archease [Nanoarchaeota archaeon]